MRPGLLVSWLLVLGACEQYDTMDGVFQPATVADAAAPQATLKRVTDVVKAEDDGSEPTETDEGADATGDGTAEATTETDDSDEGSAEDEGGGDELTAFLDALDAEKAADEAEPESTPAAPAPAVPAMPLDLSASGWGLRLVSTVPGAQPPRAILGMADGREIVVRPGDLVPEARVVVMSVGASSVEIAEVRPSGDYAEIRNRTLTVQYPSTQGTDAP